MKEMVELIIKTRAYLDYLEEHYHNVQRVWKIIQKKCDGKDFPWLYDDCNWASLDNEIKLHDVSKFSDEEFGPYRRNFFPTESEKKDDRSGVFRSAYKHHEHSNRHHWQNWTNTNGNCFDLVHNICDWMAMGMVFGDTAKEYYEKNSVRIILPEWATKEMYRIFECVYGEEK